jgi:hypothetical protein
MIEDAIMICSRFIPVAVVAAFVSSIAAPAQASGALWCNVDDANLKMAVESGVTHGMGGPFFNFKASAELLFKDVEPNFQNLTLDDKLVHSWLEGGDTRLLFYTERQGDKPFGSLTVTIKTMSNPGEEDLEAKGSYELSYFEAERQQGDADGFARITGEVTCGGE